MNSGKTETLVCALAPKRMSPSKPRPYDLGEASLPLPLKLLLVPLAPVALAWSIARFVVFVLLMCSVYIWCELLLVGQPVGVPMGGPRRAIFMLGMRVLARLLLCTLGVLPGMLSVAGVPNPAASVWALAPHTGMLDGFLFMFIGFPRAVILEPYTKIPAVGAILRAGAALVVPTPGKKPPPAASADAPAPAAADKKPPGVRQIIAEYKRGFTTGDVPIALLPEGTCTSGLQLVKFFEGSFEGGAPVQPVAIRCPFTYFNGAPFIESLPNHILRIFANPWCFCRVTFLPMHTPSAAEKDDAKLMAENVRKAMGAAVDLPLSEHGAKDLKAWYAEQTKAKAA